MKGVSDLVDVEAIEARGEPAVRPASTYEMICRGAAIDPDAPALSFFLRADDHRKPARWTYRELVRDITRTANMFTRLGVERETIIAYVLPNLPETHFVIWGGEAAGIVCAINPLLEAEAIASLLNASGAKVLVTLAPFPGTDLWSKVYRILDQVPTLVHLVLVDLSQHVRGIRGPVARALQRRECRRLHGRGGIRGNVPARIEVHDFGRAISCESGARLASVRDIRSGDLSSYFCTGGTTGLPKLAMRTHDNEVSNAWSVGEFIGDGIGPGKTTFCGLPLFHVNAVIATGLVPFSRGAHVVLGTPQGYRGEGVVKRFWEIVEHHRINFFSGVPTLYASLLDVPVAGRNLQSLQYGLCGAAPMPVDVFRSFQERTGVRLLEGYGLTEGACVSSANPPVGERRLGSIGLRMPGQLMKPIVVNEAGQYVRDCAVNETGLLVISGANVFRGYAQAEHNKGLWLDLADGRRWLNTGDLGHQDSDGYFWLTGRKKELIIRGGHNIDPATIEECLHCHPAVALAAAIGRPDAHAGELPVVFVQLRSGAHATEEELTAYAHRTIGERAARPKRVYLIDTMPLTAVGKIFKPDLRRRETLEALSAALAEGGIEDARVTIADSSEKPEVRVALTDVALTGAATQILGRFPFRFSFITENRKLRDEP
ncbi:acyl-CoA synthetase [Paraburkholderia sp. J7]|uniref:acyl-CoA synthetase n=1 Tax=Paraburkholderia sp. J7 TaxID=2805438 RepID=UPI002AB5F9E5|nr:acyl-CoA synthetase [Paraburkholderia sp. J7]